MNNFVITLLLTGFVSVTGCASTTPNYDAKFGNAVREAKLRMTINPNAGKNSDQVSGMDGKAASEAIILYQSSYKAPPPAANVINIGGNIGGGK